MDVIFGLAVSVFRNGQRLKNGLIGLPIGQVHGDDGQDHWHQAKNAKKQISSFGVYESLYDQGTELAPKQVLML